MTAAPEAILLIPTIILLLYLRCGFRCLDWSLGSKIVNKFPIFCLQTTSPACRPHHLHADHITSMQTTSPACISHLLHADIISHTYNLSWFREEYTVWSPLFHTLYHSSVNRTLYLKIYVYMLIEFSTTRLIMSYISYNCQIWICFRSQIIPW
jgi:hypothetical protein